MATVTLQQIFDQARGLLNDTQVSGGEIYTNSVLQPALNESYRTLFTRLMGGSKRVERVVYVNLPANTTVLVPANYGLSDFSEPEIVEERPAQASINIVSTNTSTPIVCNSPSHGLGSAGSMVEGVVGGVSGSFAPWGRWFITVIDANNFSLNGSMTDSNAGAGGTFTPWSQLPFQEVMPLDLSSEGMDGQPTNYLGVYLWINEQLTFVGCTGTQQLRITYWASGTAPTNPNTVINIDNAIDFLATAAAAISARAHGWYPMADALDNKCYVGPDQQGGLLNDFRVQQVATLQRGPQRRRLPFRTRRSRFGVYVID